MSFIRPLRSVLYIPCSNARAVDKARGLPADALIFDLEDAVSIEEKETAREILSEALTVGGYGSRFLIVRINAIDTEWGIDDAKAARRMGAGAILLPKVSSYDDLSELSELTIDTPDLGNDGNSIRHAERWANCNPSTSTSNGNGHERFKQRITRPF